ncbi:MAG TPA: HIT family protein [Actinomycetota bacterium]|nr:HIT family protein [Actinomycetota bacterium]
MCIFCDIVAGRVPAETVFEDDEVLAFLDVRPLFPGHTLVVPRAHYETLLDLPVELVEPLFERVRLLTRAVEEAMDAEGSFVALNNKVSQSVPHLHVHVVPRRRKDGLRGFFWPRHNYRDAAHAEQTAARIRASVREQSRGDTR